MSDRASAPSRIRRDGTESRELTIPKDLWSPPVSEAQWVGTPPRLPRLIILMPLAALVCAYVSAAAVTAGHATAGGVLLFAAFIALVWFGGALACFGYRSVRYRSEAPR